MTEMVAADDGPELSDANQELLEQLQYMPGQWYVVHSFSGHERRVKSNIELAVGNNDLEDDVYQIEVPMETVWVVKNGERRAMDRVKLPGYVLVRMDMDSPKAWAVVKATPGVTGFLGMGGTPIPLGVTEVFDMLKKPDVQIPTAKRTTKRGGPAPIAMFKAGDVVSVVDGPFETLTATIADVNLEGERVTAMVELFGRDTPVELRFDQVKPL
jgi:transcription termination/antitermination protein NusG